MYPTFFFSHGNPAEWPDCWGYSHFLQQLGAQLPKPRGIVIFSSLWDSQVQMLTGAARLWAMPSHDTGGSRDFTDYTAQGDIVLTLELQKLLLAEGIDCRINDTRGLDEGVWPLLSRLFPSRDVPVVCASVHPKRTPEDNFRIGQAISSLRQNSYLVIGSGATVRNLHRLEGKHAYPADWAVMFDGWLDEHIQVWDTNSLFDFQNRAPYAKRAVTSPGHIAPLFICMGAADVRRRVKLLHQEYALGSLSLNCWMLS
jgi:4,5-DOPA dioxygenase extradiol